ncbi:MAG: Signal recognition particle receptor FtsY [Firmicutes bacterium]|nr:Signal recognition particle receptor FtsY [Bacillota bacterium]MDI6704641.1 signal recognition particle-docking protein FtsY [Bacillota bacterium]
MTENQTGIFSRLKEGLAKSRNHLKEKIDGVLGLKGRIDEESLEELEEILITADVGVRTSMEVISRLRQKVRAEKEYQSQDIKTALKSVLKEMLKEEAEGKQGETDKKVILVVGVNGVGKTTTIGKLANLYKAQGKRVLLAAGDTFRAAAIDQLEVWSKRAGVEMTKHSEGSDPAAVVFDAINAAKARNVDVLICDTAGRLHNKKNLMEELRKVQRVINREMENFDRETYIVLDATTGQNALNQADIFKEVVDITGIILTKLDGTAKGGMVFAIKDQLGIPVKFIGVGEKIDDLQPFDSDQFVDAIID